ncbi:MAG: hypothetical protein JWM51_706, partial [Microbacteriaceae bacterium]|nr:hypothetical protein [Microbacteriaceae bacterium]
MQSVHLRSTTSPRVSVIVLAWRQTERLIDCLAALSLSQGAP